MKIRSLKIFLLWALVLLPFGRLMAQSDTVDLPTGIYQEKEGSAYVVIDKLAGDTLYLDPNAVCTIHDFENVNSEIGSLTNVPELEINLTENGKKKLSVASRNNMARKMAIIIGGKLISAPIVQATIISDKISVAGFQSLSEVKNIENLLRKEIKEHNEPGARFNNEVSDTISVLSASLELLDALMHIKIDTLTLNNLLAHNAYFETYFGKGLDRYALLLYLKTGLLRYTGYSGNEEFLTHDVAQVGNTIRLNKIINIDGRYKGGSFTARVNVWEVWIKENDDWKLFLRTARKIE